MRVKQTRRSWGHDTPNPIFEHRDWEQNIEMRGGAYVKLPSIASGDRFLNEKARHVFVFVNPTWVSNGAPARF